MALQLTQIAADAATLVRRFGAGAFFDFLAVGVGVTTLQALIAPEAFRAEAAGQTPNSVFGVLTDPFVLTQEATLSLVFAAACLRIWQGWAGGAAPEGGWGAQLARNLAPLVALNLLAGFAVFVGLLFLLLPGLMIAALTTVLMPAVAIEGRGWEALARSVEMTRPHFLRLTAAWAALILPWLLLLGVATPSPAAASEVAPVTLWLMWLVPEAVTAALSVVALCLTMSVYLALLQAESGGSARSLDDVFR